MHRKGENRYVHSLIQNLADIPGGVTVQTSELIHGSVLLEGTVISTKDTAGICHVIKTAKVVATAAKDSTTIKVAKGSQLKVGDILTKTKGKAAVAIKSIDYTDTTFDLITINLNETTGLEALVAGDALVQAKAAGANGSEFKYKPLAMVGDFHDVKADDNLWVPAVVIGTFKASVIPAISTELLAELKGIVVL